jgi:hypothetical protein
MMSFTLAQKGSEKGQQQQQPEAAASGGDGGAVAGKCLTAEDN